MTNDQIIEHILAAWQHLAAVAQSGDQLPAVECKALRKTIKTLSELSADFQFGQNVPASSLPEIKKTPTQSGKTSNGAWISNTDYVYTVHIKDGRSVGTVHSEGCVAVTGYTAQEYAADPYLWLHMIHRDDRKLVLEQANRALAGKKTIPIVHRIRHKDGRLRWIRNAPVPRYDESRKLVAYDGLITDITERKKIEDSLRESEEKYHSLFEASLDAIFLESIDGLILDCNPAACKIYGYSKEELLNLTVSDLVPEDIAHSLPDIIKKEMTSGGMVLESVNTRKDGQLFPCEVSTRLFTVGGEQRVITFVHDLRERKQVEATRLSLTQTEIRAAAAEKARLLLEKEISERKQAEDALQESEKRYRTLVDTSPDAILYVNLDMRVQLCNQRAAELYGFSTPGDLLGMYALELFGLENQNWIAGDLSRFPKGWSVRGKEFILKKKNGTEFNAEVAASLVVNEKDQPVGIIGVVRDITQRKIFEQYLMRTERLAAMGKISAELAHEIKNPLQSILSNLELVINFSLDPIENQDHLHLCYLEAERLVHLTNRLLSQVNPGKEVTRDVSIHELFHHTLKLLEKPSQISGVTIDLSVPEGFPLIKIAVDQINQVLLNLSINAIEAMPRGGLLTLSAEETGQWICLNVINDGNIVPTDRLEDIFEPFYTTKASGTGLGLPISYNIIQKMGGNLSVVNLREPDRVKFTISLPPSVITAETYEREPDL